jgi:putative transposase
LILEDRSIEFDDVRIDAHITIPNHVHMIVMIFTPCGGGLIPPLHNDFALGDITGFYKYQTTKQITTLTNTPGKRFWQRNTYDHIIRDKLDLKYHHKCILENPLR